MFLKSLLVRKTNSRVFLMHFTDIKFRKRVKAMWWITNFAVQILNFKYKVVGQTINKMGLYCKKVYTS